MALDFALDLSAISALSKNATWPFNILVTRTRFSLRSNLVASLEITKNRKNHKKCKKRKKIEKLQKLQKFYSQKKFFEIGKKIPIILSLFGTKN